MKNIFRYATADLQFLPLSGSASLPEALLLAEMLLRTTTNLPARGVEVNYRSLVQ